MQLLPDELRAAIPELYSQESVETEEKTVHAKFFLPAANWAWFVFEGKQEGKDLFFSALSSALSKDGATFL